LLLPQTAPGLSGLQGPPDELDEADEELDEEAELLLAVLLDEAELLLLADEAELLDVLDEEAELLLLADEAELALLLELPDAQLPFSQVKPSGHSCPQPPQCLGSVLMFTQTSLQSCWSGRQLLLPAPSPLELLLLAPPCEEVDCPEEEPELV